MPETIISLEGARIVLSGDTPPAIIQTRTLYAVDMGQMVVSTGGNTDLFSGSFAGCLGLVLVPIGRDGGMISHIHEGRSVGNRNDYLWQACELSVTEARRHFPGGTRFVAILFRGRNNHDIPEMPGLGLRLKGLVGIEVADLRSRTGDGMGDAADQVLFRTRQHDVYLYSGTSPEGVMDHATDDPDSVVNVAMGHNRRGGMPCNIVT